MKTNLTISLIVLFSFSIFESCHHTPQSAYAEGKKLAQKYCSSCHLLVSPQMLDSITWTDHVLPAMAPKLGVQVWSDKFYYVDPKAKNSSKISFKEWIKLVDYYKNLAPQKLKPAKPPIPLNKDWSLFRLKIPDWKDTSNIATTTLVKIDSLHHVIYSGDATTNGIYRWSEQLQPIKVKKLPSPPVNMYMDKDKKNVITCIGIIKALNWNNGQVLSVNLQNKKDTFKTIGKNLPRPVEAVPGDFNKDGLQDWIICAFGHDRGGLYLFQQTPDHEFKKIAISEMPGAEQAIVNDFDHDGWPDIMALFAQAREGIWLFLNDYKGGFRSKNLLEFPPVYGSTSFQLADFDQDGKQDILYTCGDNGDYSQILKPFHGVYIFLNKGNFQYKQTYFYPVNGCTKAIAADFDQDGDLDMTSIAFFADIKNNPSESFIYFEQDKPLHFIPHAIPIHQYGRWISMDAGDYDGDGDLDIVLGNYSRGFMTQDSLKPDWNKYLPLVVLENGQ